jgi:CHAD domain-containing protein
VKARRVEGLDPAAPLRPNAARIVRTRLGELNELAADALEPGAATAQHEMRIAAKRLRYVLEIVAPCFGPEAERARDAAKALQEVLGEIHDCDTMLPRAAGIESLRMLLRARRELRFRRFHELWQAQAQSGVWETLERRLHQVDHRIST